MWALAAGIHTSGCKAKTVGAQRFPPLFPLKDDRNAVNYNDLAPTAPASNLPNRTHRVIPALPPHQRRRVHRQNSVDVVACTGAAVGLILPDVFDQVLVFGIG